MSYQPINHVQRVKDLRRVIVNRWGRPPLPYTDEGRAHLCIIIDHTLLIARDLCTRMATQFAPPEMSSGELNYLIDRAGDGRRWDGQLLAETFGLTEADRMRLKAFSFGSIDCTPAQRRSRKKVAQRQRRDARIEAAEALAQSPGIEQPRITIDR